MFQITVTVGRNYGTHKAAPGTGPMSAVAWATFVDSVEEDLTSLNPELQETRYGRGQWEGDSEESCMVVALFDRKPPKLKLDILRQLIEVNREIYWQDAIALSFGESELVGA